MVQSGRPEATATKEASHTNGHPNLRPLHRPHDQAAMVSAAAAWVLARLLLRARPDLSLPRLPREEMPRAAKLRRRVRYVGAGARCREWEGERVAR
jgi:hypothetical protein